MSSSSREIQARERSRRASSERGRVLTAKRKGLSQLDHLNPCRVHDLLETEQDDASSWGWRAVAFAPHRGIIDSTSLSPEVLAGPSHGGGSLENRIEQYEPREILRVLQSYNQDVPAAADALGISRVTLFRKSRALEIELSAQRET